MYTKKEIVASLLQPLCASIADAGLDSLVFLQDAGVLPDDRRRRYDYMESVKGGVDIAIILVTCSAGGIYQNLHWAPNTSADNISSALQTCQPIIERIKQEIPQFHTRAMHKVAFEKYRLIIPSVKTAVLRHLYKDLMGDDPAAAPASQEEVDVTVSTFFDLEEPELGFDLWHLYSGRASMFDMFWAKAKEFLEEDVGTAINDWRHSEVVHLAKAISVRDLSEQVSMFSTNVNGN